MAISPINFFLTTLRAPVGLGDTSLLLAAGTASPLNAIVSGDYTYMAIADGVSAEIVKYTSSGTVVNDTITVERAQDNTTAKAFPAGSCVNIGWPVQQVIDMVLQGGGNLVLPRNTVEGTNETGLVGIPPTNKYYAINLDSGSLWYWKGPGSGDWVYISSNNIRLANGVPTDPPAEENIVWSVNALDASLYFWNGVVWLQMGGKSHYLEINNRMYLDGVTGLAVAVGTDSSFGAMVTATTITVTDSVTYTSNPLVATVLTVDGSNNLVVNANCLMEFSANMAGELAGTSDDFKARLVLFHSGGLDGYVAEEFYPANSGGVEVGMSVNSGPVSVTAGDTWDANLVVIDGGATYAGFTLRQFQMQAKVIALL